MPKRKSEVEKPKPLEGNSTPPGSFSFLECEVHIQRSLLIQGVLNSSSWATVAPDFSFQQVHSGFGETQKR